MVTIPGEVIEDPQSTEKDPEAPYGRKKDGTPKQRPGRKPGSTITTMSTTPRRRTSASAQRRKLYTIRSAAIQDTLQLVAIGISMAGQFRQSAPLAADAILIGSNAEGIGNAVAEAAEQSEEIANAVDKLIGTTPYAPIIAVVMPVAVGIFANHNAAVRHVTNSPSPDVIIAQYARQAENADHPRSDDDNASPAN